MMPMSIHKPSAFATAEGPQVAGVQPVPAHGSSFGSDGLGQGWGFPQQTLESLTTPVSFSPVQNLSAGSRMASMQLHNGVTTSVGGTSGTMPVMQQSANNFTSNRRMSRHQSLPVSGDQFTNLVKRQEAARLRKISNGLNRSASSSSASIMGNSNCSYMPGASSSTMTSAVSQGQLLRSNSSMLSSQRSNSQMSSLMQASIMQSSMMLTQMMNQRIASNNAALRHNHVPIVHQATKAVRPTHGPVTQVPFHSINIPTATSVVSSQQTPYSTMMPPRPAINMALHATPGASQQPDVQIPTTQTTSARSQNSSPPLEPSARAAVELVVTLGAKMKQICEHQTVLMEQVQHMRQKIDEKDDFIRKLQEHDQSDAAGHVQERGEMSEELERLKKQVHMLQSLIDAAARGTTSGSTNDAMVKRLSELNIDSGDTEEDCSTTKGEDPDGEEPSTASTSDDKVASRPDSANRGTGRYYFKAMTSSSRRKRRELDDLFRPKESQLGSH